jgi:hypothetical protein
MSFLGIKSTDVANTWQVRASTSREPLVTSCRGASLGELRRSCRPGSCRRRDAWPTSTRPCALRRRFLWSSLRGRPRLSRPWFDGDGGLPLVQWSRITGFLGGCHRSLVLNFVLHWREHSNRRMPALAVVKHLQVFKERVGQVSWVGDSSSAFETMSRRAPAASTSEPRAGDKREIAL